MGDGVDTCFWFDNWLEVFLSRSSLGGCLSCQ